MEHLSAILRLQILFFADDAAIFAESLKVLVMALVEVLHEEVKPLGLKISWAKTKRLDETVRATILRS